MESWLEELASLKHEHAREEWARGHPELHTAEAMEALHSTVVRLVYSNVDEAARLSSGALSLARFCGDSRSRALAIRSRGHVHFVRSEHSQALGAYAMALALFESAGRELDIARTLNGAVQCLIYLGDFDRALEWAARAEAGFRRHGDELRVARLWSNVGNILYRQDRHAKAMEYYRKALEAFERIGEPGDLAAALSNIAVCSTSLGQFGEALDAHRRARQHCEEHGLTGLVAAADYNIAYLHYLRGEYLRAMELYTRTRVYWRAAGDTYHLALCDLDESEMYLELNLTTEGGELARRAAGWFECLGMGYERGKALVNKGVCETRSGDAVEAVRSFRSARKLFVEQHNEVWPALIDLFQAILAHRYGDTSRALRLCRRAYSVLRSSRLPGKATLCQLLEAQLALHCGNVSEAREVCQAAIASLAKAESPSQRYQAHLVMGQIEEATGDKERALEEYQLAHVDVESLRSRLWGERSRISFLNDKLAVYEGLVSLYIERQDYALAFSCIEQAKSRSMSEMLNLPELLLAHPEIEELRRNLNWHYRQIERLALQRPEATTVIEGLEGRAREYEEEITRQFTALRDRPETHDQTAAPVPLEELRASIPDGTLIIEYYEARARLHACVLDRDRLDAVALGPSRDLLSRFHLFTFQISKFRLGSDYINRFADPLKEAVESNLRALYDSLVRPLETHLAGARHVIFCPHGVLHSLPLHALHDGDTYLIDRFSISYSPSAGVLARCVGRPRAFAAGSLVLGLPTPQAPEIAQEARAVASILPDSLLFEGSSATEEVLRRHGPAARFVHVATHGLFRRDNPLFSSIRLGDSHLSLLDLYRIRLSADLVTLSGCSTGLHAVVAGDELVGLVRGLLRAGARSALVSLWDLSDRSATEFMRLLYPGVLSRDKASAVRSAMLEVRDKYPHPYHWAPFVLVGNPY